MTAVKKVRNINLSPITLLRVWFLVRRRCKWLSIMAADRKRFDREHVVLAALAASDGATLEPVQVQKLFFLVDNKINSIVRKQR